MTQKRFLEVRQIGKKQFLYISPSSQAEQKPKPSFVIRRSPIFPIVDQTEALSNKETYSGKILFIFVQGSAYSALGSLIEQSIDSDLKKRIHITKGLASIVVLIDNNTESDLILGHLQDRLICYEIWEIESSEIIQQDHSEPKGDKSICDQILLDYNDLSIEYSKVFTELVSSLNQLTSAACFFYKESIDMIEQVYFLVNDFLCQIKYLSNEISENEFRQIFNSQYRGSNRDADFEKELSNLRECRGHTVKKNIRLHQIKDSTFQLSALVQTLARQAFSGVPPILNSSFESGENSLLGIGEVYLGLIKLNSFILSTFASLSHLDDIEAFLAKTPTPPLPDNKNLGGWANKLKNWDGLNEYTPPSSPGPMVSPLIYFSNRLGFRETKLSIAAAIQTINLASLPPWNLCTIFHEYMHSHVRALFSKIHPISIINDDSKFDKIYEIYKKRTIPNIDNTFKLLDYFHAIFMIVSGEMENNSKKQRIRNHLTKDEIKEALRTHHHFINEIVVHILDFDYFYNVNCVFR